MTSSTSFATAELSEPDGYRALSILAIISLLLGMLSVIALAHPAAWSVPILAMLVSSVAIWRIGRKQDSLSGRGIAMVGLALSLFFGAAAPSRYFSQRAILNRQARDFAQEFLEAISAGELNKAHQATLSLRRRQPRGTLLDEHYENSVDDKLSRDNYFSKGMQEKLVKLDPGFEVKYYEDRATYYHQGDWFVNQRFYLYRPGESKPFFSVQTEVIRSTVDDKIYLQLLGMGSPREIDRAAFMRRHR